MDKINTIERINLILSYQKPLKQIRYKCAFIGTKNVRS